MIEAADLYRVFPMASGCSYAEIVRIMVQVTVLYPSFIFNARRKYDKSRHGDASYASSFAGAKVDASHHFSPGEVDPSLHLRPGEVDPSFHLSPGGRSFTAIPLQKPV